MNSLFRCPDCDTPSLDEKFRCSRCGREVRVSGRVIDLLPKAPPPVKYVCNERVRDWYLEQYRIQSAEPEAGWGGELEGNPGYNLFLQKVRSWVEGAALGAADRSLLIDLSAGRGYYTFALAKNFERVLHCDLSLAALLAAEKEAPKNVWMVRCDFRRPPLAASIASAILLLDGLEYYGLDDDRATVMRMIEATRPGGRVLFDLHTRRWFDWKQTNFHYSKADRESLMSAAPSSWSAESIPFGRWPTALVRNRLMWVLSQASIWLPPIRTAHLLARPCQ